MNAWGLLIVLAGVVLIYVVATGGASGASGLINAVRGH